MAKDSQLDPKQIRKKKARNDVTAAESSSDNGTRNHKKQSGNRHKPGNEKR